MEGTHQGAERARPGELDEAGLRSRGEGEGVFEVAPDGIVVTATDGRVLAANRAFCSLGGYDQETLPGRHWREFVHGRAAAEVDGALAEVRARGRLRCMERLVREDGSMVDVDVSMAYRGVDGGRFYVFLRDLSARVASEQRELEQQSRLARFSRLNTLGEMASGLAHELNQPLAAIVNYSSGVLRRLSATEGDHRELIEALQNTVEQADRAGAIIRRMRNFVRRTEPVQTEASLNEIAREALSFTRARASHAGVQIDFQPLEGGDRLVVDAIQIQQVLLNLIRNALEAMDDAEVEGRRLGLELVRTEGFVQVSVSDSGPGVSADVQGIFGPFVTTKPDGLGLGLAVSRSIVESHGGKLWCESAGPGARFRFTLPA